MEMYQVETAMNVVFRVDRTLNVFADNAQEAKKEAEKLMGKPDNNRLRQQIYMSNTPILKVHTLHLSPRAVVPVKGEKRPQLTKIQKKVIQTLLLGGPQAKLSFDPGRGEWLNTAVTVGYFGKYTDSRTVISLRKKNILIPIETTKEERRVQEALGTMMVGSFAFVLNMKEVKKRKVYKDVEDQLNV